MPRAGAAKARSTATLPSAHTSGCRVTRLVNDSTRAEVKSSVQPVPARRANRPRRLSTRSPSRPSTAGSRVTAAETVASTTSPVATPIQAKPGTPVKTSPVRPTSTLIPASTTDRPAVAAAGQGALFDLWRFHAFFTTVPADTLDTVAADQVHRHHAIIEQVHADLKNPRDPLRK